MPPDNSQGGCIYLPIQKKEQKPYFLSPELFSSPVLSVASSAETLEGSPLNLSCVTHLSPHSPHTILWYLFYRNSTVLQGPETSSKYQVPTVGLADTGSYFCEVQADNSSIRKQSAQVPIAVKSECLGCWGLVRVQAGKGGP